MEEKNLNEERFFKPCPPPPPPPPPPIVEIDCIITKKVYDACRQQECEFFEFAWELPEGWDEEDVAFSFAEIVPSSVEYEVLDRELINGGPLARIEIEICARVNLFVVNQQGIQVQVIGNNNNSIENIVCFTKDVILYMPDLEKMEAIAEAIFQIAGEPILEFPDVTEDGEAIAFIPIGAFIIVKSIAEVQLLVPTYGFCPTPPLCEDFPDVDPCDEFAQLPFPEFYPPQPNND